MKIIVRSPVEMTPAPGGTLGRSAQILTDYGQYRIPGTQATAHDEGALLCVHMDVSQEGIDLITADPVYEVLT